MKPNEKGYIAGIIDGEGYIGVCGKPNVSGTRIVVTSTHQELTQMLVEMAGVGKSKQDKPRNDGCRVPSWQWSCFGHKAVGLLREIRQQLIIKRGQADCVLKIANYMRVKRRTNQPMNEADLRFCTMYAKRIKALNSRERNKRLLRQQIIPRHLRGLA